MLSHVYALKDIVSAIQAAAIIVHDYGVDDYQLESGWMMRPGAGGGLLLPHCCCLRTTPCSSRLPPKINAHLIQSNTSQLETH
jgi:hypothetical protein